MTGETRYIYDGMRVIQERNSSNVPMVARTRGNDLSGSLEGAGLPRQSEATAGGIGGLLARSDTYSSGGFGRHACYFADGNGNIVNLIDAGPAHTVWATYRYSPYGVTTSSSGTLATANTYRFSSKEWITNPGLYYYGYRFYDPGLQRWLNRDPIGEPSFRGIDLHRVQDSVGDRMNSQPLAEPNLYRFANNASIYTIDPDGRNPVVIIGIIGGYGLICDGIIIAKTYKAKKEMANGTCVYWQPRCLQVISIVTGMGTPITVQFCKDCNGNFSASLIFGEPKEHGA